VQRLESYFAPASPHRCPASAFRAPDYESGGQEFESLRARHKPSKSHHNLCIAKAAMQNRKICMASAWLCVGSLKFGEAAWVRR
jgi:hypothetical protein